MYFQQPLQMRAVSSPSLTESPLDVPPSRIISPKFSTKPEPNGQIQNELNERGQNQTGESILEEFEVQAMQLDT